MDFRFLPAVGMTGRGSEWPPFDGAQGEPSTGGPYFDRLRMIGLTMMRMMVRGSTGLTMTLRLA